MKRNELFAGLKESAVNKVPVSPRDIKEQLEDIGFSVKYELSNYTEFKKYGYPEYGHFTQWLRYNNRRYAVIVYMAVKEDDGSIKTYISQCLSHVCPRYNFSASDIKRDLVIEMQVICNNVCAIYDETAYMFFHRYMRNYCFLDEAVIDLAHSDVAEYEYDDEDDGTMYRETYEKNSDGSYSARLLDITHLECEEKQFYILG